MADEQVLRFADEAQWAEWLDRNHASSAGIWIQIAKKGTGVNSVTYGEALEVALCYGWIDGQKRKGPHGFWLQRFTPRRDRSIWSKVNRTKASKLVADGRMKPAGLAAIARAKENGHWDAAYDAWGSAEIPNDLAQALAQNPRAADSFAMLSRQNRYAVLFRLQTAKKPGTRTKRLEQFVRMLTEGKTIHPQK